jgi:hypothetical protein
MKNCFRGEKCFFEYLRLFDALFRHNRRTGRRYIHATTHRTHCLGRQRLRRSHPLLHPSLAIRTPGRHSHGRCQTLGARSPERFGGMQNFTGQSGRKRTRKPRGQPNRWPGFPVSPHRRFLARLPRFFGQRRRVCTSAFNRNIRYSSRFQGFIRQSLGLDRAGRRFRLETVLKPLLDREGVLKQFLRNGVGQIARMCVPLCPA